MSVSQTVLMDLPDDILLLILAGTDTLSKLSLRQCCKQFRQLVDSSVIRFELLTTRLKTDGEVQLKLSLSPEESVSVEFRPHTSGFFVVNYSEDWEKIVENKDHIAGAVKHLLKVLRNPKFLVERLVVDFRSGSFLRPNTIDQFNDKQKKLIEQIREGLRRFNHKISAGQFQIYFWGGNQNDILSILPFLKPRTLESIFIHNVRYRSAELDYNIHLDEVAELEQWKHAKELHLMNYNLVLPLDKWSHFHESRVRVECLSLDDVKTMVEASTTKQFATTLLNLTKNKNEEHCNFRTL